MQQCIFPTRRTGWAVMTVHNSHCQNMNNEVTLIGNHFKNLSGTWKTPIIEAGIIVDYDFTDDHGPVFDLIKGNRLTVVKNVFENCTNKERDTTYISAITYRYNPENNTNMVRFIKNVFIGNTSQVNGIGGEDVNHDHLKSFNNKIHTI